MSLYAACSPDIRDLDNLQCWPHLTAAPRDQHNYAQVLQDAQPDQANLLRHRDASQHSHASHTAQHDISNPGLQWLWEEAQAVMQDGLLPTSQMLPADSTQVDAQSQMEAISAVQAQRAVVIEPERASCMSIQVIALAATGSSAVCCTCAST